MTLVQFTVSIPKDNELTDFRYLCGLEKEIESFYRQYRSIFIKFLSFYENKVNKRRKKGKIKSFKKGI